MGKIRLGGLKTLDARGYVAATFHNEESHLTDICLEPLQANKINLNLLTHTIKSEGEEQFTAFCTQNREAAAGFAIIKSQSRELNVLELQSDMTIVSLFPHANNPLIAGRLLQAIHDTGTVAHGLASSPSALSVVVFQSDLDRLVDALFQWFEFPAYGSPYEWHAAYQGQSELLERVIASYRETPIKTYGFICKQGYDLWNLSVPTPLLGDIAEAFSFISHQGIVLPMLHAQRYEQDQVLFSLIFPTTDWKQVLNAFRPHPPLLQFRRATPVSMFHFQGPHFGDRYGIVNALATALATADIELLSLSCTIASISAVVHDHQLEAAMEALQGIFEVPAKRDCRSTENSS